MRELPTTLLHHLGYGPPHYDWLLAFDNTGPLLTFRIDRPTADWLDAGKLDLVPLGDHRRAYLAYEGPISGNRGTVTRIDQGTHRPETHTADRIVTTVAWTDLTLRAELNREAPDRWTARIMRG